MESRLIEALSEGERRRLAPYLHPTELRLSQELVQSGDPITSIYLLRDCVTSTIVDTAEGTSIEVGLMGGEGMVGLSLLFGRRISNTTVIVQMAGSAVRMSAEDFCTHVTEPRSEMFELLLQYADAFMAMVAQTAACNSIHSVDERLSRWILMTLDRVKRKEIPLTQEFLAYMLGVRRPSVSLAANGLQQMGFIEYARGHMIIKDRQGLERHTCECYHIVRNITDNLYKGRAA